MKTPEGYLKDDIKKWLKTRGAYFFMPVQMGYGKQTVDFLVCLPYKHIVSLNPYRTERRAKFVAIETKAPGRMPTPRQAAVLQEVLSAAGVGIWCDNFDDFLASMVLYGFILPEECETPAASRRRERSEPESRP